MGSPFIHLRSGREFHYAAPVDSDIHLGDIAHHLSIVNRFCGATEYPYSVAQHAVNVATITQLWGCSLETQMQALHHDDHEIVTSDIPTPFQIWLRAQDTVDNLAMAKDALDTTFYRALGIPFPNTAQEYMIRKADKVAFILEVQCSSLFSAPHPWVADYVRRFELDLSGLSIDTSEMTYKDAKSAFLQKHSELETPVWR